MICYFNSYDIKFYDNRRNKNKRYNNKCNIFLH